MEVTVLNLRKNITKVIAAINRNERVTLTYRGKRKATIIPFTKVKSQKAKFADFPVFGMWKDREDFEDVEKAVRKMREPRSF
jgi:antitoxin (DNA-binding transcriptional repressor) of toxin-antitoxin stability system